MAEDVKQLFKEYPYFQRKTLITMCLRIRNLRQLADQLSVYSERWETAQRYRELANQELDELEDWLRHNPPNLLPLEIPHFRGIYG